MKTMILCFLFLLCSAFAFSDHDCQFSTTHSYGKVESKTDLPIVGQRCFTISGKLTISGAFPITAYVTTETIYDERAKSWENVKEGDHITFDYATSGGQNIIVRVDLN